MELTTEPMHRLLAYLAAVEDQGYLVSRHQANEYLKQAQYASIPRGIYSFAYALGGGPRAPSGAQELGWVFVDEQDHVRITRLGRAVLAALEREELEGDEPLDLVLSGTDPIAYAQVINRIAKYEQPLVVDPYFKLDHFLHVVQSTSAARLLTGPAADIAGLSTALGTGLPENRGFEIRVSKEVHDRYIIPASGDLDMIGTSLSGVGRGKPSAIIQVGPPTADAIRDLHEDLWEKATPLEPPAPPAVKPRKKTAAAKGGQPRRRKRQTAAPTETVEIRGVTEIQPNDDSR